MNILFLIAAIIFIFAAFEGRWKLPVSLTPFGLAILTLGFMFAAKVTI